MLEPSAATTARAKRSPGTQLSTSHRRTITMRRTWAVDTAAGPDNSSQQQRNAVVPAETGRERLLPCMIRASISLPNSCVPAGAAYRAPSAVLGTLDDSRSPGDLESANKAKEYKYGKNHKACHLPPYFPEQLLRHPPRWYFFFSFSYFSINLHFSSS